MIQGTKVKVTFSVEDLDSGLLYDPPDVHVAVRRPTHLDVYKKSTGGVTNLKDANAASIVGWYRCVVDTSVEPGEYDMLIMATGGSGVVRKRSFTVEPAFYVAP